jgi:hypothetical protein
MELGPLVEVELRQAMRTVPSPFETRAESGLGVASSVTRMAANRGTPEQVTGSAEGGKDEPVGSE